MSAASRGYSTSNGATGRPNRQAKIAASDGLRLDSISGIRGNESRRGAQHSIRRDLSGIAGALEGAGGEAAAVQRSNRELWMAAIKPPMYSVGFMPVLLAAAATKFQHGIVSWSSCLGLVLGAICIIAWLNLSNDAFDAETGVDSTKPESVVNLTGNRAAVMAAAAACFAAGLALLARFIGSAQDGRIIAMLGAAIACGYVYQGPPFRLSYRGMGEPLCFIAFGPLATPAFYLALLPAALQTAAAGSAPAVPQLVWLLSVLVGITTTVILFCSHFHQIEGDRAAGKYSPLVQLGTQLGCQFLRVAIAAPYVIALAAGVAGMLPLHVVLLTALSLPAARSLLQFADHNHTVPARIAPLKRYSIKWHMAFGVSLVLGLLCTDGLSGMPRG